MDQNTAIVPVERPIALATMDDIIKFAEIALKSKVFPDIENAQQAVVKIMLGRELGIGALASLRGIIFDRRGAITLLANLQGAVAQRAGYTWKVDKLDESACELEFFDPKGKPIGKSSLTMEQAKRGRFDVSWDKEQNNGAGGWKQKPAWQSAPRNMLFARCLTNGIKWYCPAVTNGIPLYDPDEMTPIDPAGEIIDMVPGKPEPERKPEAQPDNGKTEPKADPKAEPKAEPPTLAEMMVAAQAMLDHPVNTLTRAQFEAIQADCTTIYEMAEHHGIISERLKVGARPSQYLHEIIEVGTAVQAAIAEEAKKAVA